MLFRFARWQLQKIEPRIEFVVATEAADLTPTSRAGDLREVVRGDAGLLASAKPPGLTVTRR